MNLFTPNLDSLNIERHELDELDIYCSRVQSAMDGLSPEEQYQVLEQVKTYLLEDFYSSIDDFSIENNKIFKRKSVL